MKIKSIDTGPYRWHIEVRPNYESEALEFYQWMQENFPKCFCKIRVDRLSQGKYYNYYWEVRGSDKSEHAAIMLTWV